MIRTCSVALTLIVGVSAALAVNPPAEGSTNDEGDPAVESIQPKVVTGLALCRLRADVVPTANVLSDDAPADIRMDRALRDLQVQLLTDYPDQLATVSVSASQRTWVDSLDISAVGGSVDVGDLIADSAGQLEAWESGLIATADITTSPTSEYSFRRLCDAYLDADALMRSDELSSGLIQILGLDLTSGSATIGTPVTDAPILLELASRHPGLISIVPYAKREVTPAHRSNDVNGFSAGDAIHILGEGYCTAGFKLRNTASNIKFLLTAGHCGHNGDDVDNASDEFGIGACGTGLNAPGHSIGTLGSNLHSSGGTVDVAVITGSPAKQANMWAGSACVGSGEATTIGVINPSFAGQFGFSGTYSGQANGIVSWPWPVCVDNEDGWQTCNLWIAGATAGTICQVGDSGGPVFGYATSSSVFAAGIINSFDEDDLCYFTSISVISYLYASELMTG